MVKKFKVWDNVDYMSGPFTFQDIIEGKIKFTPDCTVLEFTGLRDKNGKFYCQDDIVLYEGKHHRLCKGTYAFFLQGFFKASQDNPHNFFNEGAFSEGEIAGNIYETPELLK